MQRLLSVFCIGCLLLFTHFTASAQEQLPDKRNLIGAGLSFSSSTAIYDGRTNNLTTSIRYAHYLRKNLALGAAISSGRYSFDAFDYAVNDYETLKSNAYYFSPFVRFDMPLWQNRLLIFNELGVSGNYLETAHHYPSSEDTHYSWGLGAYYSPGLMYRLKSNIAFQVSYGLVSYGYSGTYKSHSVDVVSTRKLKDLAFGVNFLF
ncbi:porin family protein [Chitinophaga agrisoli]|uniref:Porin family protein n=1 Tax=Chitinophaga agrisoli TaxID=2607653 RepID=A0A5B2VV88_9BACT|nr:outer membrane beta-barrel protein [Chitinophaga agrisoli]KAA2242498.1 porin family protein [Chitinophaga agrisoli]